MARFDLISKRVLLFIGILVLSLAVSFWGTSPNGASTPRLGGGRLEYRALNNVLPSDDPNIRYIEKHFNTRWRN